MFKKKQFFLPYRSIFVDVDGTLLVRGELNTRLVDWCKNKKNEGFELVLWSARGKNHALNFAEKHNLSSLFDSIVSKPGYIVDDKGWGWVKYTRSINYEQQPLDPIELNDKEIDYGC